MSSGRLHKAEGQRLALDFFLPRPASVTFNLETSWVWMHRSSNALCIFWSEHSRLTS